MIKTIEVTPETAASFLNKAADSTAVKRALPKLISKQAKIMRGDRWVTEIDGIQAAPIVFNKAGQLVDGVHRLLAVIKSGKTIKFNVYYVNGKEPVDDQVS